VYKIAIVRIQYSYALMRVALPHNVFPLKTFIKQKAEITKNSFWQFGYLLFLKPPKLGIPFLIAGLIAGNCSANVT
jgi:hypothetical protein